MSLNSFGCPLSSLNRHKDVGKIKNPPGSAFHSCGTWIQASYINHSCTSNVRRSFIGDMMIVRAICDLEEGTELFFWYHCPEKGNSNDTKNKLKYWGFECECPICSDDKVTPLSTQRQREVLRKSLEKTFRETALGNGNVQKIERLLDELNQTYSQPADKVPRLLVWDMQLLLAHGYASRNKTRQVIVAAGKVLISLGFIITGVDSSQAPLAISRWGMLVDHLVEIFMLLRNAFVLANNTMNSDRAGEYAKTAYKMVVGEDVSFDIVWGANAL